MIVKRDEITRLQGELREARERVVELEKHYGSWLNWLVTAKQIDAAWTFINNLKPEARIHAEAALIPFGIKRCRCGGSKKTQLITPGEYGKCPTCAKFTGKGWVKK